jgi:hypothetical protein
MFLATTAALVAGLMGIAPGSLAPTQPRHSLTQKQLEQQINNYAALLGRLGSDIQSSPNLAPSHVRQLDALSNPAVQATNTLVAKIQTDTTSAQFGADTTAVGRLKAIFAVLTAQVFETIEADNIQAQFNIVFVDAKTIGPVLNALAGSPGYANALRHYQDLNISVGATQLALNRVVAGVLDQTLSGYPSNTTVFSRAASKLRTAQGDLARAADDESVIGMAIGGYTGN